MMWGSLERGPYSVGFQRQFVHDRSRTWKLTGPGDPPFKADLDGRPIEFNTWFPAVASNHHRQMLLADYYPRSAPPGFVLLNTVMNARADWNGIDAIATLSPGSDSDTHMAALSNAHPFTGRFPAVLMFSGGGDDLNANVVMAEYLASHGMVVVSVSLLGGYSRLASITGLITKCSSVALFVSWLVFSVVVPIHLRRAMWPTFANAIQQPAAGDAR
jgi:hypothetical protein